MDKETNVQAMDALVNQAVCIRIETLTEGIRLVFAGVMKMLESLDVDSGRNIAAAGAIAAGLDAEKKVSNGNQDAKDNNGENVNTRAQENKAESTPVSASVVTPASALESTSESELASASASTVTVDDITKIIVQKIKQNRSNNAKIGQILKAYGADKVGELPASKYEAFLTDLASL